MLAYAQNGFLQILYPQLPVPAYFYVVCAKHHATLLDTHVFRFSLLFFAIQPLFCCLVVLHAMSQAVPIHTTYIAPLTSPPDIQRSLFFTGRKRRAAWKVTAQGKRKSAFKAARGRQRAHRRPPAVAVRRRRRGPDRSERWTRRLSPSRGRSGRRPYARSRTWCS